jgi:2-polyprenyl-3-methyl-5-hydroxy-6-metoxy-1,4-benzoquinol methylase
MAAHEIQLETETVACPVCHTVSSNIFLHVPDRFELARGEQYSLVKCQKCTLIYLNPRPVEQASSVFYEHEEYTPFVSAQNSNSGFDRLYQRARGHNNKWKRKKIERQVPEKGRLLDVGCGTGEFIEEMARAGWQVRGLERDPRAAAYAVEKLKLNVVCGTLENMPAAAGSFDVVTMWHVLEHLYQPHKALMQIRDMLKPEGLLVIAVPNANSLDALFYKQNWVAYDAPRHLQHFNLKSLRSLCEMHNFTLERKMLLPIDCFFNALMSEKLIEKREQSPAITKIFRLARAGIVAKSAFFFGIVSNLFLRPLGSTLLLMLRK